MTSTKAAKAKKKDTEEKKDPFEFIPPSFEIIKATIIDDLCNYRYRILTGIGAGDTHNVTGTGIIMDDMKEAFAKFNVHAACIDDIFKHSGIDIKDVDKHHSDELTLLFNISGFIISGGGDNESIVLVGTKYSNAAGGRIYWESPQVSMDDYSSYTWHNELKTAADTARSEVGLYKGGKCTKVAEDEPENPDQGTIDFNADKKAAEVEG